MTKYVYAFTEGDRDMKDLLGGKGANLAEMVKLGLPVPPGFTITTDACRAYLAAGESPETLDVEVTSHLRNVEQEMDKRYDYMTSHPDYQAGKKYYAYGLKPRFIVIDELAALAAKLERDYQSSGDFIEYLTELILKGRQSGVIMIVAMQRPDGEYLKTSLRDQFMKRISVGHLEDTGNKMMFGDANANKVFKKIDEIDGEEIFGRGYIANGGEVAREFYSPVVPFEEGFSFFEEYKKLPVLQ